MLVDRYKELTDDQELLTGIVAATIANHSMGAETAKSPLDFMPGQWHKKRKKRKKKQKLDRPTEGMTDMLNLFRARGAKPGMEGEVIVNSPHEAKKAIKVNQ
jgi:hypothetical protein